MKRQFELAIERDVERWLNEGGRDVERPAAHERRAPARVRQPAGGEERRTLALQ